MDFVANFVGNVASTLVFGAIKQACYCCRFNTYVEQHMNQKDYLISARENAQKHARNAKRRAKETNHVLDRWLNDANTIIRKAEELEQKANANKSCCYGHCPNWIWRYFLGRQIARRKEIIIEHYNKGTEFIQVEGLVPLPGMEFYSSAEFICFRSTKLAFDELLTALKDDKVYMIGLYGMGGCGKTTLAKQVGKEAEKMFDKVVLATVSSAIEIQRIQAQIADSLGLKFEEEDVSGRARRLWKRIKDEKRILIILDDVWEKLDLEAIGIQSDVNCNVLLTTRLQQVCNLMDCQAVIPLNLLNKKDAWSLFQRYAHITENTSVRVRHLAEQISKKCNGLPVAIAAVACSLKGEGIEAWKLTLRNMRNYKQEDVIDSLQKPYTCLRSSYDNLKDREAKLLFSLCSVFPEDFEISEELLITFVKGLGLFDQVNSYDSVRDQVIVAKDKLIKSCLLLDERNDETEDKIVKMHDLVRDVALWIGKEKFKLVVGHERSQYSFKEGVTRKEGSIKYLCCEAFPSHLDYPKLEFLFVSVDLDRVTIPDKFFEGLKKLKVLALHNKGEMNESPLTMQFQKLINLLCLYLYRWYVSEALFSNDRLNRLESLRLFGCRIWEKPFERNNCDDGIGSDTESATLEELIIDGYYYGGGGFTTMPFVRKPNLFNLRVLRFSYNAPMVYVFTPAIAQSLKRLEELHIDSCDKLEYIFGQDNDGCQIQNELQIELPHLKLLKLGKLESLVSICPENYHLSCPSLLKLCLEWCRRLTGTLAQCGSELAGLPVHIASLQNLEQLEIRNCGSMRYIFSASTTKSLPRLKELRIVNCGELEQIFMDMVWSEGNDGTNSTSILSAPLVDYQDTNRQNSGSFNLYSLQKLDVRFCSKLKSLFPASIAEGLDSLQKLKIDHCKSLEYIFPTSFAKGLNSLQKLKIDYCKSLEYIFPTSFAKGLNSLQKVKIQFCESLEYVFPITCARVLENLSKIEIVGTDKLEYVFGQSNDEVSSHQQYQNNAPINLPALEVLHLGAIPALISICSNNYYATCPSLQQLSLEKAQLHIVVNMIFGDYKLTKQFLQNLRTLEMLVDKKTETIFDLEGLSIDGQQVTFGLTDLSLDSLSKLKCIWSGAKHILTLQNLENVIIRDCANLNTIFPSTILGSLPQLKGLIILGCDELEKIIEEDEENHNSPTLDDSRQLCCPLTRPKKPMKKGEAVAVCFPKLKLLVVEKCKKLKHVLPFYEFPRLEHIIISQCSNIEKVFTGKASVTEEGKDAMLPQLKNLILMNLPMLTNVYQGIDFHRVTNRVVHHCQRLSLTPTTSFEDFKKNYRNMLGDFKVDSLRYFSFFFFINYQVIEEVSEESIPNSEAT